MSEDLALSLLEELINSQQELVNDLNELTLQVEFSDSIEFQNSNSVAASH